MTETIDDVSPLGKDGKRLIALAKTGAVVIGILATSIIGAVTSYRAAATDAQLRVQAGKDKAEAGYQLTKEAVVSDRAERAALEKRVAALEARLVGLAPDPHRRLRGAMARRPPVPLAPAPKALPADLDKAERQVYRGAPAPAVPRTDGGR